MNLWQITSFTLMAALAATLLMLPFGLLLAWILARGQFRGRVLLDTLVSLPLVMPPVATGLLLLMLFAPRGPIGAVLARVGIEVVFTRKAVVLAMAIMALPLFVRTARAGFEQVERRYEAVAATLGAPPWRVFLTVSLPLAAPSLIAATVLGFARSIGEFAECKCWPRSFDRRDELRLCGQDVSARQRERQGEVEELRVSTNLR